MFAELIDYFIITNDLYSIDRPYPDSPWSQDAPWRNRGNFGGNNSGGGGGNSNFGGNNDNFGGNSGGGNGGGNGGGGNNNLFNNDNFNNDSFERKWNAGSGNGFNSFNPGSNSNSNSGGNGGGNNFDRDTFSGLNNYGNNSNNNNSGGGGNGNNGGGGGNSNFGGNNNNGNNNFGMNNNSNNGGGGSGNGGGNGNNFMVHLRGMPFDCGEKEIYSFFEPLNLVGCEVIYNNQGRHTGEADAFFGTVEECQEAMKKHKEKMGSRYIELFANKNIGDKRGGGSDGGRRF